MGTLTLTYGLDRTGQEAYVLAAPKTHQGMASWGGAGPPGTTCRLCKHWNQTGSWRKANFATQGAPLPARCLLYERLMYRRGNVVPHDAESCKYYEASPHPQPLRRPESVS